MTATATRPFTRFDAAAIRRAARKWFKMRTAVVEYGLRENALGIGTANSATWPDESDMVDWPQELTTLKEEIANGFTLDLYVSSVDEFGDPNLEGNLDARWNGTAWEVFCPFEPAYVELGIPSR